MDRLGVTDPLIPTAVLTPTVADISAAHQAAMAGRVAAHPIFLANLPSVADPTMGPAEGGHVLSLEALFTPYDLGGGWEASPEPERWLEVYGGHLESGFLDGVRRWRVMTPVDYERQFLMVRGHAGSFSGGPLAALLGREKELTRYRTPVKGLYLSGAGTFPGAGIWGASGRNAARVVLAYC
jgi:phytoene dehydrogenase-like protein